MTPQDAYEGLREWIGTALLSILGWLGVDIVRKFRGHGRRLAALEREHVTRADLDKLRDELSDTVTSACGRIESRTDDILLHLAKRDPR